MAERPAADDADETAELAESAGSAELAESAGSATAGPGLFPTARLEAFSDGVFAIAITLLVLDLAVPEPEQLAGGSLATALAREWPSYLAYLVSFLVIGVIWINHHTMCRLARAVDRPVLFVNLFLLLVVSVIPFPTRVLASYLREDDANAHTAAALYGATMLVLGVAFSSLFLTITRGGRLLHQAIDPAIVRATVRRFGIGVVLYSATIALAFVDAVVALIAHLLIGLYYCFDQLAPSTRRRRNST